ncbi:MAG TPA: hypothetical protein VK673_15885 [Chthoniobacterales bacterium]|nr:hypothetical protein [Chthoniobacterales bacterium]
MAKRKKIKPGPGIQWIRGKDLSLADEIDYIRRKAAERTISIVGIGPLIAFSAESGDAWLLDPVDHLATRVARDGESESVSILETDKTFGIGWKGSYQIDGEFFVYLDHELPRVTSIHGYPTAEIARFRFSS